MTIPVPQTGHIGTPAREGAPLVGFHHVAVTVTDLAASESWYGHVLGMRRVMVEPHADGGTTVVLARPDFAVLVGLAQHPRNGSEAFGEHRTGLDHMSFAVGARSDLDVWRQQLEYCGVGHSGIVERDEPFPYALIVFRDPDNIQLEVTWS